MLVSKMVCIGFWSKPNFVAFHYTFELSAFRVEQYKLKPIHIKNLFIHHKSVDAMKILIH